jgi:hypothetical protein
MYWTDESNKRIERSNLDGSDRQILMDDAATVPSGISVDGGAGKMYWTDYGTTKRTQRSNLDGTLREDHVTGLNIPAGIAVDVVNGKVYWTDFGAGSIRRANLDGTSAEDVWTGLTQPAGLALDVPSGKVYWASSTGTPNGKIRRANLDGSGIPEDLVTGLDWPFGVALDPVEGKVHWTNEGSDTIQRSNMDGSNIEGLVTSGLNSPSGIALDLYRGKMYWVEQTGNKIQRANLDGSNVEELLSLLGDVRGIALGTDSAVTAVRLTSFEALAGDGSVELRWETGSEVDNLGFHLYRSTSAEGPYERLTETLIPGLGSSPEGARYRFVDRGLTNGTTVYYELEDVETTGRTERHGPVSARPEAGLAVPPDDECAVDGGSDADARITYGDPSGNAIRVLERNGSGVVLELRTEGFYGVPQEDGSVVIEVPGFQEVMEDRAVAIPVKRYWVEAVAGRKVKLGPVRAEELVSFTSLRPSSAGGMDVVSNRRGTVRLRQHRRPRALRGARWSPEDEVRLVQVAFQGETKKALLELAPLRWDGARQELVLAQRLLVEVSFRGRETGETGRGKVRDRHRRERGRSWSNGVVARFSTKERGLYGVRFEDVIRRGRGVRSDQLRLSRQGEAVAFHIAPRPNVFGPGSTLYFVSEGARANAYGTEAVYELALGVAGETMPLVSAEPRGELVKVYEHRFEREDNRLYLAALLDAPDPWLWDMVFSGGRKVYPFRVDHLAGTEGARLELWLQGGSDFAATPDHHVRVFVNESLVQEVSWDGRAARKLDVELTPGVLREGDNTLEVENTGDTDAAHSMVYVDRYAVSYPRSTAADSGILEGRFHGTGVASVAGMSRGAYVVDVTDSVPQWLSQVTTASDGTLRFRAEAGRRYLAVSPEAVLRAEVRRPRRTVLAREHYQADYVVIGPETFLAEAEPLLELRRSQGLAVTAVPVEQVYSEFGYGESTPESIRDFLTYAYHHWEAPSLRYVLLLGDATYDFKDYLELGVVNQVPPFLLKTQHLWTVSDPAYGSVNGEDLLPDVAVGRLPAASLDELRVMVEKIVVYETGDAAVGAPIVFVADNPDGAGNFESDAESAASTLLSDQALRRIYLGRLGTTATRQAIRDAFDQGTSLLSYLGHGGIHVWADEDLLNIGDIDQLGLQCQQPLVLTMNCLNGYFHFPYFESLGEKLLEAEGKGAIAAFSPSGLSLNLAARTYHEALLRELTSGRHERLGDAVLAAQQAYAETGALPELLAIYHLLGDPALRWR